MNRLAVVKLLTRPGCVPCEQAKFILKKIKTKHSYEGKVINILKQKEQYGHYNDFLPVILVNDHEVCKLKVEESKIIEAIIENKL